MGLIALLIQFKNAMLDTDEVILENGCPINILGLFGYGAMIVLYSIGYWLVDSAGTKASAGSGSHGH